MSNYPPQPGMPPQPGYPPQNPPEQQGGGGCFSCLGCGLMIVLAIVLACAGGGIYMYYNGVNLVVGAFAEAIKKGIDDSKLPEGQKTGLKTQIDRVVAGVRDGKITGEKFTQFAQEMEKSPVFTAIMLGSGDAFIDKSELTDEQKTEGKKDLKRVMSGAFDQKISKDKLDELADFIIEKGPNNQKKVKDSVSKADMEAFVEKAKEIADEAMIPDEVPDIDYAGEMKKLVDKLLGE